MKNYFGKINKKFFGIFVLFVLLECLFGFSQIFGWLEISISQPFIWNWFFPGFFWILPFFDTSVDNKLWFQILSVISVILIPAGLWTTVIYFVNRLVKIIKKKIKKQKTQQPL